MARSASGIPTAPTPRKSWPSKSRPRADRPPRDRLENAGTGKSGRAAVLVRAFDRAGELDEAREVVHRQEVVHVRQHRAHPRGPRLEPFVTQERVQPDELPAGF